MLQLQDALVDAEQHLLARRILETQVSKFTQRWAKLFATHPKLYAADNITIAPIPEQDTHFSCDIQGLHMAGRQFEPLHITLSLETDNTVTLHLPRPGQGPGALLRWPANVAAGGSLALNPHVNTANDPQRIASYMQLSSTDWQLVQSLPRVLLATVQSAGSRLRPDQQSALAAALQQHDSELSAFKRMLRFDQAQLAEAATPQRLAIQLQHVSHDGLHDPQLSLTLSRSLAEQDPAEVTLHIGPSPLFLPDSPLSLPLGPQGWSPHTLAPLDDAQRQRLNGLINILLLALIDTVAHGATKDSVAEWGKLSPQLRAWSQMPPTAPKAPPEKAAPPARSRKPTQGASPTKKPAAPKTAKAATKAATKPTAQPAAEAPTKAPAKPPSKATTKTAPKAVPKADTKTATKAATKAATPTRTTRRKATA